MHPISHSHPDSEQQREVKRAVQALVSELNFSSQPEQTTLDLHSGAPSASEEWTLVAGRPATSVQEEAEAAHSAASPKTLSTEDAEDPVAGTITDPRQFFNVDIGGRPYKALYDPGASISLVGPSIAERFRDRLQQEPSMVKSVFGGTMRILGILPVVLDVDGVVGTLKFKAVSAAEPEVILGIDFCRAWEMETKSAEDLWRVRGGKWHEFANGPEVQETQIYAECAGISEVEPSQREQIMELVDRLLPPAPADGILGYTTLIMHHIDVQGARPFKHHLRRMSPKVMEVAQAEVMKMNEEGIIQRSSSDWCSAPVLVKKSNGEYRFCIDFRDLNKLTRPDAYPMRSMDSILDKLREARYLTKIDLKQAYFQILLGEESRKYTAFAVPGLGLFEFVRMPFGLSNAPMTFQRLIDALCGPECEPHVFGYLDDIIIATSTFDEHVKWLENVLSKLKIAGLVVNKDKCEFCCSQVTYLGYVLDREGLRPDPERVAPVLQYPAPTTVKQLRRFLGMVNWYSRFIRNESEAKVPLLKLLRSKATWEWGEEQQEAFEQLKRALTEAPVLARPDFSRPFAVQCDASDFAIGAVLTQEEDGQEHPVVYVSRVLTSAERNYTTTEKECLALIWAIKKLRPYLEGYEFTAITDHSALRWLRNLKEPTGRLMRWALELQQWKFEIVHKRGALHYVPDALSRAFEVDDAVAGFETIKDPWYVAKIQEISSNPNKYPSWREEDGMIYKYRADKLLDPIADQEIGWRLVVPVEHRERVMSDAHRVASSGHLGVEKTYDRVAREYYWPGMWHDVHAYVQQCPECQRYKVSQLGPQGLMGKRVVERPWAVVAADTMEFPSSKSQNKYLIVFQDLFTKWIELKPVRTADGKSVARALEELILFRWEAPDYLLTDNGKEYDNKLLKEVLEEYGVKHVTTPPYHPQANPVERANRSLKTMIATFVGADHRTWDQHLHELRHALNTATQSSTRVSPAFLNYGRHPSPVKSLRREVERKGPVIRLEPEVWKDRMLRLDALRDLVAKHLEEAQGKQERRYNKGKRHATFNVGDLVLRRVHVLSNAAQRFSAKLAPKFEGPFAVREVRSPTVYIVETPSGKRNAKVHVSDLKRYVPPREGGPTADKS